MRDVISVEKEPRKEDEKRSKRIENAVRVHKAKKTPGHHRTHYELRQQARDRAWKRAQAEQEHRKVAIDYPEETEAEPPTEPAKKKQLRSVVIID
jgi:chloramphenicol 3-O-phosphotransferase